MISMAMLHDAQRVLKPVINRTPVIPTKGLVPGCDFYLKADCLQKTGAFKLRGAYYKIATLSDEEKARGVIACSAGNHAQGVAYAARDMGIKATICIPEGAPISKIEATRSYGANVVLVPGVYDDAYAEAVRLRDEQGLTFIHPFNDYRIMAGQGTIGLEILEQLPDVDMIFVPIGGGGLIAGLAYAVKNLKPDCRIVGVQAAGAPSMAESLKEGKIITLSSVDTVADGIKVKTPRRPDLRHVPGVCGRGGDGQRGRDRQRHPDGAGKAEAGGRGRGRRGYRRRHVPQGEHRGQDRLRSAVRWKCGRDHAGAHPHPRPCQGGADGELLHGAARPAPRAGVVSGGRLLHGRQCAGCEPRAAEHQGGHRLLRGKSVGGNAG